MLQHGVGPLIKCTFTSKLNHNMISNLMNLLTNRCMHNQSYKLENLPQSASSIKVCIKMKSSNRLILPTMSIKMNS